MQNVQRWLHPSMIVTNAFADARDLAPDLIEREVNRVVPQLDVHGVPRGSRPRPGAGRPGAEAIASPAFR